MTFAIDRAITSGGSVATLLNTDILSHLYRFWIETYAASSQVGQLRSIPNCMLQKAKSTKVGREPAYLNARIVPASILRAYVSKISSLFPRNPGAPEGGENARVGPHLPKLSSLLLSNALYICPAQNLYSPSPSLLCTLENGPHIMGMPTLPR